MKIYNTLTRQKEEFVPIEKGKAMIYVCGPTVYNFIHIGNARPLCVFDVLRKYLIYRGYKVTFVQNFTDVDDKIIRKANEEGVSATEIAKRYIAEYQTDAHGLNVADADIHPRVTENMGEIIKLIKQLVDNGYAYEKNGDVYFRTAEFNGYGKLSHMPLEDLEAGARIDVNDIKENPMDFALWKAAKEGEPNWKSPWGEGRPGWHIECSAMAGKYLAQTIDIHCGGQDLVFPHHENEIAQSECANGTAFANYWMHNAYLNIDNKKMSKSQGNFFTTREVAEKFGYEPIRFMMLQAHYRSPINYTQEVLNACVSSLERLYTCRDSLKRAIEAAKCGEDDISQLEEYRRRYIEAMDDDLNTADALSVIFELVREINIKINDNSAKEYLEAAAALFDELTGVLGLLYQKKDDDIPQSVLELAEKRAQARKDKDFALADKLRGEIAELGYSIEETRQGTKIEKLG